MKNTVYYTGECLIITYIHCILNFYKVLRITFIKAVKFVINYGISEQSIPHHKAVERVPCFLVY